MSSSSAAGKASGVKALEYDRQQALGLENRPLSLARHNGLFSRLKPCCQCKGTSTSPCAIRGATQEPHSGKVQEEQKWLRFFDDPSMWWDNRAKNWNNYPDFKHAYTGESLCIGSSYCPKWVHHRLNCLKDPSPAGIRAQYMEGEGCSFQSGRSSSYLETKLTGRDGSEPFKNCNETQEQKVKTSLYVLLAALKASSSSRDLERGKKLHADATEIGDDSNIYVASSLVDMYANCGSMVDARGVFDRMQCHDVVSWTALILGYAENMEGELALQLFARMLSEGCAPDARTFVAALKACTSLAANEEGRQFDGKLVKMLSLEEGMAIHSQAAKSGCDSDIFVASTLVDMYGKCGSMVDARGVFDRMLCHNVVSWNALMLGYAENGEGELALQLFACMLQKSYAPNARTFIAALKACTSLAAKEEGKQVDGKLVKVGSLEKGIAIHSQAANCGCHSDIYVASTLVNMYAKCGNMVVARGVFDRMLHHDLVSFTALMLGYAENGEGELALQLFARMHSEGCAPDARIFVAALKACSSLAAREDGKQVDGKLVKMWSLEKGMAIHSEAAKISCVSGIFVANTLVDMYGKCGSMVDARGVFERMPSHDVVSWTALMLGYAENGEGELALQLFPRMGSEGYTPDDRIFVATLKAYTAKEEGKQVGKKLVKMGSRSLENGLSIHSQDAKSGCDSDAFVASTLG